MGKKIFEGLTVLDFTSNLAGPTCASLFADQGAEVIKIERPVTGDDTRVIAPTMDGVSLQYMWLNRGKKSVVLSLKDPEAQDMICRMAESADVVIESYKPGQMKKYGLDYESLIRYNPKLIYCSISAYGQEGAYSRLPGFDVIAQAMSGLVDMTGHPEGAPTKMATPMADFVGAINAFGAISAALYHRLLTGEGQYIDVSLVGGLLYCNRDIDFSATFGEHPERGGNHDMTVTPFGVFKAAGEDYVALVGCTHNLWPKLCKLMGKQEWLEEPEYSNASLRMKHKQEVIAAVEAWLQSFPDVQAAIAVMRENGIPCNKVMTCYETAHDPVLCETGFIQDIPTPPSVGKTFRGRGPWIKLSKTPFEYHASPDLGQHNYEVLERYGWSREKIDALEAEWAGA